MSLSIIFAGTPHFAVPSLKALIDDDAFDVPLVITQPDRPVGRKQILTPPPVKILAESHNIPVWQPENINKQWEDCPCKDAPDFLVVAAYGQLLTQKILDFPIIAPINVHASLLPKWRGASPINHAILSGDATTGITIQKMVLKLDQGDILSQEVVDLSDTITAPELHDLLAEQGAALLCETLKQPLNPQAQDNSKATHCSKLSRADGMVDPSTMTAVEIDRKARGLMPWPGVTCSINSDTIKILETTLEETENTYALACADNSILHITKLQKPGSKPISGKQFSA